MKRESYKTELEAVNARDRWIKLGNKARINYQYASIQKFVVIIEGDAVNPKDDYEPIRKIYEDEYLRREEQRTRDYQAKQKTKKTESKQPKKREICIDHHIYKHSGELPVKPKVDALNIQKPKITNIGRYKRKHLVC